MQILFYNFACNISSYYYKYYFKEKDTSLFDEDSLKETIAFFFNNDLQETITGDRLSPALYYLLASCVFSLVIAQIIWLFVRNFKVDRRIKIFRFKNHWNYYFNGEIQDFPKSNMVKKGKHDYTDADILTQKSNGETELISGTVFQYTIDPKTNELKTIYLTQPSKWKKTEEKGKKISYLKPIKSDCFIIPYSTVLEINLNYLVQKQTPLLSFLLFFVAQLLIVNLLIRKLFF